MIVFDLVFIATDLGFGTNFFSFDTHQKPQKVENDTFRIASQKDPIHDLH